MKAVLVSMLLLAPLSGAMTTTWRKVGDVRGFDGMRAEMQHLVDSDPDTRTRTNHLCVVAADDSATTPPGNAPIVAYIYWREAAYIFAFGQTRYPPIDDAAEWAGGSIDLKHDVVPTDRDIKGSIKRVSRPFVDRIIRACADYGDSYVIEQHRRG